MVNITIFLRPCCRCHSQHRRHPSHPPLGGQKTRHFAPDTLKWSGWWFQPSWKILVSWDDYSQYIVENKKCSKPPTSNPLRSLSKQPITKDHPLEPSAPAVPSCSKIPLPESQAPGVCWVQPAAVLRFGLLLEPPRARHYASEVQLLSLWVKFSILTSYSMFTGSCQRPHAYMSSMLANVCTFTYHAPSFTHGLRTDKNNMVLSDWTWVNMG